MDTSQNQSHARLCMIQEYHKHYCRINKNNFESLFQPNLTVEFN